MSHPLENWQSVAVKNLLNRFFSRNFEVALLPIVYGDELIDFLWENKSKLPEDKLREYTREFLKEKLSRTKYRSDEIDLWTLFDLSWAENFIDIGANKLDTINKLASRYSNLKKLKAIDVVPRTNPVKDPERIDFINLDASVARLPIKDNSADIVNSQFVFHHYKNLKAVENTLKEAKRILNPEGNFILWEETFEDEIRELDSLICDNNKLGIKTDLELTEQFYQLSSGERIEFIKMNDWIINANNPHMPWTDNYHSWETWLNLFKKNGFSLQQKYNLGLRSSGRVKQGVHMIATFKL